MKFFFTIANKLICLSFLFLFGLNLFGQKFTDSPYSRYGVGLINPVTTNGNFSMGQVGYAWRPFQYKPLVYDSLARSNAKLNDRGTNFINLKNPASFSNISLTTFEASIVSKNVNYTSASQERTGTNTQLGHMSIALPLGEKWGLAFGIRPFSSVGYDYNNEESINGTDVNFLFEGKGGVNEIFAGTAVEIIPNLSLGIRGKFLFGTLEDDQRIIYESGSNFFNTIDQLQTRVSDVSADIGLQYRYQSSKDNLWTIGVAISPFDELSTKETRFTRSYEGAVNFESIKDTIQFIDDQASILPIAPTYGIGFAYEKRKKWLVAFDITSRQWGGVELSEGIVVNNSEEINLGFEKFNASNSFGSFFSRMGYRVGLRYNTSILTIDGQDVEEFGMGFGFVMPLRKSFSTLNIGVELGRRGSNKGNLTQEDFLNLQVGITVNDKWFIKRKYD